MLCEFCGQNEAETLETYGDDEFAMCGECYDHRQDCPCGCGNNPNLCVYASTCILCGKKYFGRGYGNKDFPCFECEKEIKALSNLRKCRFCDGVGVSEHGISCSICDGKGVLPDIKKCYCGQPENGSGWCDDCEKSIIEIRKSEQEDIDQGCLSGFTVP